MYTILLLSFKMDVFNTNLSKLNLTLSARERVREKRAGSGKNPLPMHMKTFHSHWLTGCTFIHQITMTKSVNKKEKKNTVYSHNLEREIKPNKLIRGNRKAA